MKCCFIKVVCGFNALFLQGKLISNRQLSSTLNIILLILFYFSLPACVTSHSIPVSLDGRESLSFTGRGAAAGIMLDSVIPGGTAIGIAIDEGIAKEISSNLHSYSKDFAVQNILTSQIDRSIDKNLVEIKIKHYGFRTSPKGEDQISAWLDLEFVCRNKTLSLNYPQDFSDISTADFAVIKVDGKAGYDLLNQTAIQVFKKWKADGQCGRTN